MSKRSLKHIHIREASIMRKIRRSNKVRQILRIRRATRKRVKTKRPRYTNSTFTPSAPPISFKAGANFELLKSPEDVIAFINDIEANLRQNPQKITVQFDFSDIVYVDNEAIGLVLAYINALSKRNIPSFGNLPISQEAYDIFMNSGFLENVKLIQGKKIKSVDTFIVQKGAGRTDTAMVSREIKRIMQHLTGIPSKYPPLYTLITEIISNSIEHANKSHIDKNWLFSVHYENGRVRLMIGDIGRGIMSTLRKKFHQTLGDLFLTKDDTHILYDLFDRKYQSSTFEDNRNQGLPKIKDLFEKNYISDLCVITNKVYLDFNDNNSRVLYHNLSGTFYSLVITSDNIQTWQNRVA